MYLYAFIAVVVLFVKWYECRMSVFPPFSLPPPFPSLSFWGSGHRLVLIFLGSFMFIPTVTACSFCFCFLAVDVVDICMKRTGMSASLHSLSPLPPSTYTVLYLFHLSHSLHSLSSGLGTHGPCVSLCCLTLASLLTALFSVDITSKHLLLFDCIVIQCGLCCQSLIVDEKDF